MGLLDSQQDALSILTKIVDGIKTCFEKFGNPIIGIGISIPGPFDYKEGISKIFNCNKYHSLFGVNIKNYLFHNLKDLITKAAKKAVRPIVVGKRARVGITTTWHF